MHGTNKLKYFVATHRISERKSMSRFMFDTNVFCKILKMQVPTSLLTKGHQYFVTHVQKDELNNAPQRIRGKLLSVFQVIPQEAIPTESAVVDVSRVDGAKIGDSVLYNSMLQELNRAKPKEHDHNIKDALIAETAIKNGIVLVTDDKALQDSARKHEGTVMPFDAFSRAIAP
jgi:predicted nucleic acid-binding protein